MTSLDTPRTRRYTAAASRLVAVASIVVVSFGPRAVRAEMVQGVQLPDRAQKVGENRYRAPESWEETMKYYNLVYPKSTHARRVVVNHPEVKAIHIINPSGKLFEGLNIYEHNQEVRIYIVPAPGAEPKAPPKKRETKPPARR
jgi:hypothetical protein